MTAAVRRIDRSEITTQDGASARLEQRPGGEAIAVRDRAGRLLFEYDAATGRGSLSLPEGDLRLCAPRGSIELIAAHGIRAAAGGEVSLSSAVGVSLDVTGKEERSSLRLEHGEAALHAERLELDVQRSELKLGEAQAWASSLASVVERAELRFGEVTKSAVRAIEQAENLYQRVGELYEVKAGRLRALITESLWMRGDDVTLLAKRDVRIDGDRINLG